MPAVVKVDRARRQEAGPKASPDEDAQVADLVARMMRPR
jgi:hypothetical protein